MLINPCCMGEDTVQHGLFLLLLRPESHKKKQKNGQSSKWEVRPFFLCK